MSLVTVAEVRAMVTTGMLDTPLQAIINREEAIMVERCGEHYVDATTHITEVIQGGYGQLFLSRKVSSIFRVTEDGVVLSQTNDDFQVWESGGILLRQVSGTTWGSVVSVIYVPYNDNERRKAVLIELVRLALDRMAMKSENVAGEYSYTAPDWEYERARLLRSLNFRAI